MSLFHRTRGRKSATPELTVLLAQLAARQALSPTARIAVGLDSSTDEPFLAQEIEAFAATRSGQARKLLASASFNASVRDQLLTRIQSS